MPRVPCLRAQTTGSIRGTVETGQTALPGVTVEAKSPNLQGTRTAVTDNGGRFNLTLLPPGTYTLTATLEGFATKTEAIKLGLDQVASVHLEMVAAATAEVTVTGQAVAVETESNTIGRNLDQKAFQALPTGRNYASVAQLASGVNTDSSDVRQTSITVYGSTGLENNYLVDGANTTGAEIGNQGKVLNYEFIQEVELKEGGYEAEYTGAMGGILNVITKSGGNEFHGDAFGYFDNDSLQATNKHLCAPGTGSYPNCELQQTSQGIPVNFTKQDYGADIGGFILKDKLWFFGAYDHVDNTLKSQVTIGETAGTVPETKTSSNLFSGKLTWNFGQGQTLIGSVFGDPTDDTGAVGPLIGPPTTYDGTVTVGGTDFGVRYQGILGPKWLVTGQFAYHRENVETVPGPGGGDQIYTTDNTTDVVHRLRRLRGVGRDRPVCQQDVHAVRLHGRRQLLPGRPRHQGGLRLPAGRRRCLPHLQRRTSSSPSCPRSKAIRSSARCTGTSSSLPQTQRPTTRPPPRSSPARPTASSRFSSRTAGASSRT